MSDHETHDQRCKNCDNPLRGEYCSNCGQRDIDFREDWRGLTSDFFSSMFNLDGRVPQGVFTLFFRPGLNAQLFLQGKRASQIPPLRFYLFSSLIYFIWFSSGDGITFFEEAANGAEAFGTHDNDLEKIISLKFEDPSAVQAEFNTWLPRVFLLSVPALALVTRLLFRKRGYVLLEHVVIAMQLLTFAMLWTLLSAALTWAISLASTETANVIEHVLPIWILIYPILAFRRIFELSWTKAILVNLLLFPLFNALFAVGAVLVLALAMWLS
ncbi:DUF3667 domain-containing protein [Pelagicoccus albus]|uniref:DUF3667 domain-containing protein n=1 Tax=Pelagicoccus albus TaxID=415222 RepID=A0A7X1E8V2_9BACT|nr:DUF3667 domain-containing protein [Pelagicoccus albus]MBC2606696.1 DUF3667 domain-containing protein [Pelagicoccus albus]